MPLRVVGAAVVLGVAVVFGEADLLLEEPESPPHPTAKGAIAASNAAQTDTRDLTIRPGAYGNDALPARATIPGLPVPASPRERRIMSASDAHVAFVSSSAAPSFAAASFCMCSVACW